MRQKTKAFLLFAFVLVLVSTGLNAQNITGKFSQQRLGSVLKEIERQSGLSVIYNKSELDDSKTVTATFNNTPVRDALKSVLGDDVKIVITDKMVTLSQAKAPQTDNTAFTGRVIDEKGEPVPGAGVLIAGTNKGAMTDINGVFTLPDMKDNSELEVSCVGYESTVVRGKRNARTIVLREDILLLEETVVIGYGKQSRAKVTNAIAKIDGSKLVEDMNVSSFDQALGAKLPGVVIQQTSGAPGAGVNIKIRGTNSINYSGSPLIVVDGVPLSGNASNDTMQGSADIVYNQYTANPLALINPADIESIDVLKDAASAAIYGSRGSNGVIIITTKQGKEGKTRVNFGSYVGFSQITKKIDVMDAYEISAFTKKARDLAYLANNPGASADDPMSARTNANWRYPDYIMPYVRGEKGLTNTDWQDEIYRNAFQQNYDLSLSGGNSRLNYYVSGNFTDQDGIIINTGMKRYGLRTNLNANLTDRITMGLRVSASRTDNKMVISEDAWSREALVIVALMYHPMLPVYNADGSLATDLMLQESAKGTNVASLVNPVALATMVKNNLVSDNFNGAVDFNWAITNDLALKTSFGVEAVGMNRVYYRPKSLSHRYQMAPTTTYNTGFDTRSSIFNWISETNLTYTKQFGNHSVEGLLGFSAQKEHSAYTQAKGTNFPNDVVTTINAAATTTGKSFAQEASMVSFLGRVMYSYMDKYLFTASLRRDGSSRFAANTKWGWFPSVSAGWNISREDFFPRNNVVTDLKLRASYGLTGNANIPYYGGTALMGANNYVFGSGNSHTLAAGFAPSNSPNTDLSWESTATINLGIDAAFANNMFKLAVDAYQSATSGLLLDVTVPASSGFTTALQNIGKVRNRGIEAMLSTTQRLGHDWTWESSLVMSTNQNKVMALGPGQTQMLKRSGLNDDSYIVRVGESLGSFFGYEIDGRFMTQEEFDSYPHIDGSQGVGDFKYVDVSGPDGKPDGKITADDRVILGNANPKFTWGFNNTLRWKNLDFTFNVEGKHGQQIFNATHRYLAEAWGNNLRYWGSEDAPRPVWAYGTKSHTRASRLHVEDASFVRIRNISLGYTFHNLFGIGRLRVYASTTNPFTFTKYSGYNPEVSNHGGSAVIAGEDFGNYPVSRSYILGINVSF